MLNSPFKYLELIPCLARELNVLIQIINSMIKSVMMKKCFWVIFFMLPNCLFAQTKFIKEELDVYGLKRVLANNTFKIKGLYGGFDSGTAFILSRFFYTKSDSVPSGLAYILVTAAHVLDHIEGEELYLHGRKKNKLGQNKTLIQRIQIREGSKELWFKPFKDIDLSVMYITLDTLLDVYPIEYHFLATDVMLDSSLITVGDEALTLGFPYDIASNKEEYPVLRSGKIASYPLLPSKEYPEMLLDIRAYPGTSGSPVFTDTRIKMNQDKMALIVQPHIIGMVSDSLKSADNMNQLNISKIIPSQFIIDAIEKLPMP